MSELHYRAADAQDQAKVYIAAILAALGPRDPMDVLREMPSRLRETLAGLSPAQLAAPEAPGKWSMSQVVQHLADSDLVGAFRFRMVLAQDRPVLSGYDQDRWIERVHRNDADTEVALTEFVTLRRANVRLLEKTTPEERDRVGLHAERGEESLGSMIPLYAGHDIVHLRQLDRIRQVVAPPGAAE